MGRYGISLDTKQFLAILEDCPKANHYLLAISGGMDSSVLLDVFARSRSCLDAIYEAVYVDHGLDPKSQSWGHFCRLLCSDHDIPFTLLPVTKTKPDTGVSTEAWAREQRYALLADKMTENTCLLTAHHLDDQVETFMLQALRGSGPRGLSAMPIAKPFASGIHVRPFLSFPRSALETYALTNQLDWHDDPMNEDVGYTRNFVRKQLFPLIESRWHSYRKTLQRTISHQQEIKSLLDSLAREDFASVFSQKHNALELANLKKLSRLRINNVISYCCDIFKLPLPSEKHFQQIHDNLIHVAEDSMPCVFWKGVQLRRYRNYMYLTASSAQAEKQVYQWHIRDKLQLPHASLHAESVVGYGVARRFLDDETVTIRYRQGGERIRPVNHQQSKLVKKLFQEQGIPPWQRQRIPFIYIQNQLAVIPNICVDQRFSAAPQESAWEFIWNYHD